MENKEKTFTDKLNEWRKDNIHQDIHFYYLKPIKEFPFDYLKIVGIWALIISSWLGLYSYWDFLPLRNELSILTICTVICFAFASVGGGVAALSSPVWIRELLAFKTVIPKEIDNGYTYNRMYVNKEKAETTFAKYPNLIHPILDKALRIQEKLDKKDVQKDKALEQAIKVLEPKLAFDKKLFSTLLKEYLATTHCPEADPNLTKAIKEVEALSKQSISSSRRSHE